MNLIEKMKKIFDSNCLMTLATVASGGIPKSRTVNYARDTKNSSTLYFMTKKDSNKVQELEHNQNVHIVVEEPVKSMEDLLKMRYVKANGTAELLTFPEEIKRAVDLINQNCPYQHKLSDDISGIYLYSVNLKKISITDNSISFGYTDVIEV